MSKFVRTFGLPVVSLVIIGLAFMISHDPTVVDLRGRHYASWLTVGGDWASPALHFGKHTAIESRVQTPRLQIPFRSSDTYRLQIFYVLEGNAPAEVLIDGKKAASLPPGKGWQDVSFSTPRLSPRQRLEATFRVPEGRHLILDRIRFHNHIFRLSSFFVIKPSGGSRGKSNPWNIPILLAGMIFLFAIQRWLTRNQRNSSSAISAPYSVPAIAATALILTPILTPFEVHVRPGFFNLLFFGMTAVSLVISSFGRLNLTDRKAWALRSGFALGGLLFALVLVEGLLWIVDTPFSEPKLRGYSSYSPHYGWANRPGTRGWQVGLGFHVRINRFGHRGPDMPLEKKKGVFRILGLGDSFTFGWGMDEKDTFLSVMAMELKKAGHQVEIWNAGVPAWGITQSLTYLRRDGVRIQPDLVLFTLFTDDFFVSTMEQVMKSEAVRQGREEEAQYVQQKNNFIRHLRLSNIWFNYIRRILLAESYKRRNPFANFEKEREVSKRNFDQDPHLVKEFTEAIGSWKKTGEEMKIPIVFSYIPFGGAIHHPDFQGENRILKKISRSEGLPYLDLLSIFEKVKNPSSLYLHPVDNHMSKKGHRLFGEKLAEIILKNEWISKAK